MSQNEFITNKDLFTHEEWKVLRGTVYVTFIMVAASGGQVQRASVETFLAVINEAVMLQATLDALGDLEPQVYPGPLHRKLLLDIGASEGGGLEEYRSLLDELTRKNWKAEEILERAKASLKGKLSSDDYQRFVGSLLIGALKIAKSSGAINEEEAKAITHLNHFFDLDPIKVVSYYDEYPEAKELIGYRILK